MGTRQLHILSIPESYTLYSECQESISSNTAVSKIAKILYLPNLGVIVVSTKAAANFIIENNSLLSSNLGIFN